jgi:hypothetical protein
MKGKSRSAVTLRLDLSGFQRFNDLIGQWKYLREMH